MTEPTDKADEQQLDEYLKGDSSVSRQYRQLPGAEVPPSLDRLVLRQAQEAVKRPSRPAWMRWTAPLAVAATAVLVISIVIETGLQDETIVSAPTMQEKRKAAAEAPIETRMIEDSADVPPPPKLEAPPPVPAAAPAPAPAPAPEQSARARQPVVANEAAEALLRGPTPAAQANSAAFVADAERQKEALEETAREQELSAMQRAMRGEQDQVAGPRDTIEKSEPKAVLSYSRPISASADNRGMIQRPYTDPEAWLKDIRQLRTDNKQDEADREWRRFRTAFPDYEVAETDAAREMKK